MNVIKVLQAEARACTGPWMQATKALRLAVVTHAEPAYTLAWAAGLHPTMLSQVVHGARRVRRDDPRLRKLVKLLGVKLDDVMEAV